MTQTSRIKCNTIDVCMIVYNESEMIERCISALLDAGFDSFVVLDMHSEDDTVAKISALGQTGIKVHSYPRLSLLKYGYAEARNVCAAQATRDWVLFVDADEILVAGCQDGAIPLSRVNKSGSLFSIRRNNLSRPGMESEGGIFIKSVESHNRLYKPHMTRRWKGYIHEEIRAEVGSGSSDNGETSLIFDHYSDLKSNADTGAKTGLYALMLLRIYNNPLLRDGTNEWWFNTYVPEHLHILKLRAASYSKEYSIDPAFYELETAGDILLDSNQVFLMRSVSNVTEATSFDLKVVRRLHAITTSPWTGTTQLALWGEWDHPGEGARTLESLVQGCRTFNWDRFIRPGMVCIDIGGHSGDTAIPMGLFCYDSEKGIRGHVVVVEPNPVVLPILNVNLSINTNVAEFYVVEAAVTNVNLDEIELADHGNGGCNGGILTGQFSYEVSEKLDRISEIRYKTRGIDLSSLINEISSTIPGKPVGFIKIDCEGYDKEIIKPCRDLLSIDKPTLFIEWFDWFNSEDDKDLFDAIDSIDYVALDPVTLEPASALRHISDLLCIHKTQKIPDGRDLG